MTLRAKTLTCIGATLALLLGVLTFVGTKILTRSYERLEIESGVAAAGLMNQALRDAWDRADMILLDWSSWDATYGFIKGSDTAFARENLNDASLESTKINLQAYVRLDGTIRYATLFSTVTQRKYAMSPNTLRFIASKGNPLCAPWTDKGPRAAVLWTEADPLLLISRPILRSDGSGACAGTLIFGRFIDANERDRLGRLINLKLEVYRSDDPYLPSDLAQVAHSSSPSLHAQYRMINDRSMGIYQVLRGADGRPLGYARAVVPRGVHINGILSRRYLMVAFVLVGVALSVVALAIIEILVLRRLTRLTSSVEEIAVSKDTTLRVPSDGADELTHLAEIINSMLGALEEYQAGITESEARLSSIVETNADAIVLVDTHGRFVFCNAAAERLFGMPREELLGRSCDDPDWGITSPQGDRLTFPDLPYGEVARSGLPVNGSVFCLARADGGNLLISANAAAIRDASGNLSVVVASLTDITERRAMEERLAYQAYHDSLTNLPNRLLFQERLTRALLRAKRTNKRIAVIFLDLDNFKLINDSLGHTVGDQVLACSADRIRKCLRVCDTAARLGGDEFAVLLEEVHDEQDALLVTSRIDEQFRQPLPLAMREVFANASMGIALGSGASDPGELLRNADAAMYEAKRRGKGRSEFFRAHLNDHAMARLDLENDLRRALERGELVLHYQPIVSLTTGMCLGLEALVRWNHPTRGLISPLDFVPLAEENGLISPIGSHILHEACRQLREWKSTSPEAADLYVGVNLSARQFQSPSLIAEIGNALRSSGLRPDALTLEITESTIMDETHRTERTLAGMKHLGVRLAIDDFGTGYSSLSYLRRFPIDCLKIDRTFVSGLADGADDRLIVSSTIGLAHGLGLTVVAEGVERMDQVTELKGMGCDSAQGFLYAHGLPAQEVIPMLSRLRPLESTVGEAVAV